jgi:hypothetical protein
MEGTSGAADLGPLRGGSGEAALGPGGVGLCKQSGAAGSGRCARAAQAAGVESVRAAGLAKAGCAEATQAYILVLIVRVGLRGEIAGYALDGFG